MRNLAFSNKFGKIENTLPGRHVASVAMDVNEFIVDKPFAYPVFLIEFQQRGVMP